MNSEKWLSVKEVAAKLGVSVDTVRRWIRRGWIKALKFPAQAKRTHRRFEVFRISDDELGRFIRVNTTS